MKVVPRPVAALLALGTVLLVFVGGPHDVATLGAAAMLANALSARAATEVRGR